MFLDIAATRRHPVVVAQRGLVGHRHDGDLPLVLAPAHRQLDDPSGGSLQELAKGAVDANLAAVHRDDDVTVGHCDPSRPQRGPGARVRGLTGNDANDLGPIAFAADISAQQTRTHVGITGSPRCRDVGVRGVELRDGLPQDVVEVVDDMAQINERTVPIQHAVPVDAVHVLTPVVAGHQAAILVEHLTPFGTRINGSTQPGQVDANVRRVVVVHLVGGGNDDDVILVTHHQTLPVTGDRVGVDVLAELVEMTVDEVVVPQHVAGDFPADTGTSSSEFATTIGNLDPDQAILDRCQSAIGARGHREGHHPLLEAISGEVADDLGSLVAVIASLSGGLGLGVLDLADLPSLGGRTEGGHLGGAQRNQPRTLRVSEGQVEGLAVVVRVKGAGRQHDEVLAVGGEDRA